MIRKTLIAVVAVASMASISAAHAGGTENGVGLNGLALNGINFNGLAPNGNLFNGASLNGNLFNGTTVNGSGANGSILNGTSSQSRSTQDLSRNGADNAGQPFGLILRGITLGSGSALIAE